MNAESGGIKVKGKGDNKGRDVTTGGRREVGNGENEGEKRKYKK